MSREIPSSAITAANSEVKAILGNESKKGRGHYHKLSPEIKADLGKYASVNGVAATLRRYSKTYPSLKESSVRTWRDVYIHELKRKVQSAPMDKRNEVVVTELPQKKTGRPYLLGDILDERVRKYIHFLRIKAP